MANKRTKAAKRRAQSRVMTTQVKSPSYTLADITTRKSSSLSASIEPDLKLVSTPQEIWSDLRKTGLVSTIVIVILATIVWWVKKIGG